MLHPAFLVKELPSRSCLQVIWKVFIALHFLCSSLIPKGFQSNSFLKILDTNTLLMTMWLECWVTMNMLRPCKRNGSNLIQLKLIKFILFKLRLKSTVQADAVLDKDIQIQMYVSFLSLSSWACTRRQRGETWAQSRPFIVRLSQACFLQEKIRSAGLAPPSSMSL